MKKIKSNKPGLSLIEIVLYFALMAVVMLVVINFSFRIFDATQKSGNLNELSSNVNMVMQKISKTIKLADNINIGSSVFDDDTGALALDMPAGDTPMIFSLDSGNILLKEGLNTAVELNNGEVTCSQLRFTRVTYPKSPDQVIIEGSCQATFQGKSNLNDSFVFHTAVSLRK